MTRHRVAILTGIPAPYREPIFARLAQEHDVSLKVFYTSKGHQNVGWLQEVKARSFEHEFLHDWAPGPLRGKPFIGNLNLDVRRAFREFEPTYVIIYGYSQLTHWLAFDWCARHRVPVALRSDSNFFLDHSRSWTSNVRRRMIRRLTSWCHRFLAVGSANRAYWLSHGADPQKIVYAPYAVDNDHIGSFTNSNRKKPDDTLRLVYVGRLVDRKRVDILMEAFNRFVNRTNVSLTILGDGPCRDSLQRMQSADAHAKTNWLGRQPNEIVFSVLAEADLLVHPSEYEPWGLVINEAMAAGLPVIASPYCGAARDLMMGEEEPAGSTNVREKPVGWLLEEITSAALLDALEESIRIPGEISRRGDNARARVRAWSFERTVAGFREAIDSVDNIRKAPSSNNVVRSGG